LAYVFFLALNIFPQAFMWPYSIAEPMGFLSARAISAKDATTPSDSDIAGCI